MDEVRNVFKIPLRASFLPDSSELKFAQVVKQTADLVMITDRDGIIEYVNPAYERTTGFSKDEVIGKRPNIHKSGKHETSFYAELWQTILNGRTYNREMINRKKDGSVYLSLKTITPILNESGEIAHFVSTDKDVTEQRRREAENRELLQKYHNLFGYSADGMAYCDLKGTLLDVNASFCQLVNYSSDELIGKKMYQDISAAKYWELGNEILERLLRYGEPARYEKEYLRKDGRSVPVIVTAFPVKDDDGKIRAVGVIVKDITERKRHETELQVLNEELRRSNVELERFAHIAAHDLQAPLRSITCYLELLEKSIPEDKTTSEYMSFVTSAAKKLQALIKDILIYAGAGISPKAMVLVDSNAIFSEAMSLLREAISESGAIIEASELPMLYGDPMQLSLLFQNLLSNAIKYCKGVPKINVHARLEEDSWVFSVRDNGIGIAKEHIPKLFVMFHRLHSNSEVPGTGIGLSICKKIVEAHGGRISVESKRGEGTTFTFTLPSAK